jgi:hypothetical protein
MVPIKTSVEDIKKLLDYLGRQIGWVEQSKVEKALGSQDERKFGAMVELGLILRDGGNLRATERGMRFVADPKVALREVLGSVELYRATLEWLHYGGRGEATAAEIGQYWEASHKDTLGGLKGSTLASGAVTFGRIVEGAGLGNFLVGRKGRETRCTFDLSGLDALVNATPLAEPAAEPVDDSQPESVATTPQPAQARPVAASVAAPPAPTVSLSTSPSVHVNVEIHIAADATADTVREIFKNMARYVLDKPVTDDDA